MTTFATTGQGISRMKLIDTHTHLYLPEFDSDRDEMVARAIDSGVTKLLMPNINLNSVSLMHEAVEKHKDTCFQMIGLHPTSVKDDYIKQVDGLLKSYSSGNYIAVGETGIDLYWDKTHLNEQKDAFRRQVRFAIGRGLPVVIHSRESFPEVFSVLDEFRGEKMSGVFHAFSGTLSDAGKIIDMGFFLGIGGPLTYKNSGLGKIVLETGIDHLVLETDSPYLTPVPYRGKRNESSYICIINKKLAEILSMDEEETASITFKNSCALFNISQNE